MINHAQHAVACLVALRNHTYHAHARLRLASNYIVHVHSFFSFLYSASAFSTLKQTNKQRPTKIDHFNVDVFTNSLDPSIWKRIHFLTQTTSKKLTCPKNENGVYFIPVIYFTINWQYSFPLHTLLTDVIDTCGNLFGSKPYLSTEMHATVCAIL